MDKVYGVFGGEGSVWNLDGFFTDEVLAEKYCAKMTEENDWGDGYRIIELENLQNKIIGLENVDVYFYNTAYLRFDCKLCAQRFIIDSEMVRESNIEEYGGMKTYNYSIERNWIRINVITKNEKVVDDRYKKILQDMFAIIKYKHFTEGMDLKEAIDTTMKSSGYTLGKYVTI